MIGENQNMVLELEKTYSRIHKGKLPYNCYKFSSNFTQIVNYSRDSIIRQGRLIYNGFSFEIVQYV